MRFFKLKKPKPTRQPQPRYDSMVKEPVVALCESIRTDKGRWRVRSDIHPYSERILSQLSHHKVPVGDVTLTDKKTGRVFKATAYYSAGGGSMTKWDFTITAGHVPFTLNIWEKAALVQAINDKTQKCVARRERMEQDKCNRERIAREARQKAVDDAGRLMWAREMGF